MTGKHDIKVAITGGIGSGKSYVCSVLKNMGVEVFDCDRSAKKLMRHDNGIKAQLTRLIGEDTYIGGQLNKAAVAAFMMKSEDNTASVNAIVHPAVARDFIASKLQWMECAILFESGFDQYVDKVVCVTAPEDVRIQRVMRRDNISRQKVLEWIGKQMPQAEVLKKSDFEIINDGKANVEAQLREIIKLTQVSHPILFEIGGVIRLPSHRRGGDGGGVNQQA